MDFVAIDFETANQCRSSACSLGLVLVENDEVTERKHWLIKPSPNSFSPYNVAIHGITEADVENAPSFLELWPDLEPYIQGKTVAAHNASFETSVLRKLFDIYNIRSVSFDTICSYRLSQAALPTLPSYNLAVVCSALGIPLQHHDALSDAEACAKVITDLSHEQDLLSCVSLGHFGCCDGPDEPCRCLHKTNTSAKSTPKPKGIKDIKDIRPVYHDDDFWGKSFVFTGTLVSMPRERAMTIVQKAGGKVQSSVTRKTDYLVAGIQDLTKLGGFDTSSKFRRAQELREQGYDIEIIGEDDFLRFIDFELYECL